MLFNSVLAGVSLLAATAAAVPRHQSRQVSGALNVVYWGQNGGGTIENNDLSAYCTNNAGIDVIVLAFLYSFGNNGPIPSGTIGQSCYISTSGEGQQCDALASAIQTCQNNGVKVILSIGGASSSYSLSSDSQASSIGQYIWESYGNSGNTTVQRPFGSVSVDGFDFDIEMNNGYSQYFPSMISTLRNNFASDSSKSYVISGAPQCPLPEPNMGVIIQNSQFDYLWVQFYNNDGYTTSETPNGCSLGYNGNSPFNYNDWVSFTAGTPSKNAKIFVGVPAAPDASNGAPSGAKYYITPAQLGGLVSSYGSNSRFGGIMMWSAGFSDSNVIDGCTYAQQAYSILRTGKPCGGGPISSGPTSGPTGGSGGSSPTSTTTAPSSGGTGVAGQYDQCGGSGYTGPTTCQSGWVCTEISSAYSQCDPA